MIFDCSYYSHFVSPDWPVCFLRLWLCIWDFLGQRGIGIPPCPNFCLELSTRNGKGFRRVNMMGRQISMKGKYLKNLLQAGEEEGNELSSFQGSILCPTLNAMKPVPMNAV